VKNLRGNERQITVSQVAPKKQFFFTYQYGNMFDFKVSVEMIGKLDSLPSPRLCGGLGGPPTEDIQTVTQYEELVRTKKLAPFDMDAVNKIFLGTKSIKKNSGLRKKKSEEDAEKFMLMQMAMVPEDFSSL